jgi:glycosyltransferase involved in cell wall biosynthesis
MESGVMLATSESPLAEIAARSRPEPQAAATAARTRVAYLMSRFPKLTETFILFEMLALERQGIEVQVYPLLHARNTAKHPEAGSLLVKVLELARRPARRIVMHPEAARLVHEAHFVPLVAWTVLLAQLATLRQQPLRYLGALWTLVRANWGSLNYLLGALAFFPKAVYFARLMRAEAVDHVHAHFASHPAAVAWVIHYLTGIRFSFTAHGADFQVDQHMLREKVAAADRVVTISECNKRFIMDVCGPASEDRIRVMRCGVDTRVFHPANSPRTERTASQFDIVCTGTLYEVKGQTHLIEACRLLVERGVDVNCHLVGDGPWLDRLRQQASQAGLTGRVHFRGRMTRHEIAELLRASDVSAAPSVPTADGRREGIPVAIMEAMASGLPVVASDISGIPELIEHQRTGLLVPPNRPDLLADALEHLHRNTHLSRRLAEAGRQRVLREYDLHKNASALATYFRTKEQS